MMRIGSGIQSNEAANTKTEKEKHKVMTSFNAEREQKKTQEIVRESHIE
jgi:hypothetical protein